MSQTHDDKTHMISDDGRVLRTNPFARPGQGVKIGFYYITSIKLSDRVSPPTAIVVTIKRSKKNSTLINDIIFTQTISC